MSVKVTILDAFKINIFMLKLFGVWTSKNQKYTIYKYIITGFSLTLYFLTILELLTNFENLSDSLYDITGELQTPIKTLFFWKHFEKIIQFLNLLKNEEFCKKNPSQTQILQKAISLSITLQKLFFISAFLILWIMFVPPYFKKGYHLFVLVYLPNYFRRPVYFECFYSYIMFCTVICTYVDFSIDAFLYTSWIQLGAQFDCVGNTLANLKHSNFKLCVKHYKSVLKCVKLLDDSYSGIMAVQVITSTMSMCFILYLISLVSFTA